jgi:MOSC domain-containing protein YiiM
MRIVSVNVGLPQEIVWRSAVATSGIVKSPVAGPVNVRRLNLDGDRQADLSVHGGPQKAVYGYPSEHYPEWRAELPEATLSWGAFGENLTTEGVSEETLYIGDRLRIGTAVLMVTQPRTPCYKLQMHFQREDIIKRMLRSGRSGCYFSVEEEGRLEAGSAIEFVDRDEEKVSVADINRIYAGEKPSREMLERILRLKALPEGWKEYLGRRASARGSGSSQH